MSALGVAGSAAGAFAVSAGGGGEGEQADINKAIDNTSSERGIAVLQGFIDNAHICHSGEKPESILF